ncbi:MAG: KEOPS complex subunit Pcc1 [archaeon]|jgi:tRNA threonylcarbamoyladenosine modification (KEOPS) complex  Pcc1 subunit
MINLEIKVDFENSDKFFKSILPELKDKFERSEITISKNKTQLKIEIRASDKAAARASLNAIMKPLILFNELEELK